MKFFKRRTIDPYYNLVLSYFAILHTSRQKGLDSSRPQRRQKLPASGLLFNQGRRNTHHLVKKGAHA